MANSFDVELETPEMDRLSSLAENLVYRLPGCSDLMIRKTIQDVYRDFCRRSCCLLGRRHFVLDGGKCEICVTPALDGVVDSVTSVSYNGRPLRQGVDYRLGNGGECRIAFRPGLVPNPECDARMLPKIDVEFVIVPKINSEDAPSWLVQKHGEGICSGVLARLMSMTGKAWSDQQQASVENVRYENAVCTARIAFYGNGCFGDGNTGFAVDASHMI